MEMFGIYQILFIFVFLNCLKFSTFENLLIFKIEQFQKFDYFMNLSIMEIRTLSKENLRIPVSNSAIKEAQTRNRFC